MFNSYKKTIKREFFVTGLVTTLIIAAVFITVMTIGLYTFSIENAKQKLKSANTHVITYAEGVLDSLVLSANVSAAFTDISDYGNGNRAGREQILQLFLATTKANQHIKFCYAGFETGELLINDYKAPEGYDPRIRPWYTSAVAQSPELSVGLPYQDVQSGEWLIAVSRALVNDQNEVVGVVAVDCTLEYVKQLMAEVLYYDSQSNYVVDSNHMVFAHQETSYVNQNIDSIVPGLSQLFQEQSGYIQYTLENTERLAYYQKMKLADWIVVSAIDEVEVAKPVFKRIAFTVLTLVILAILLGLAQVHLYDTSFVRPIASLRDRIEEITLGKPVVASDHQYSNLELAGISQRIEEMAETSLRKKAYELKLILESTSNGILVLDLEGKVVHTNAKFKELWGLTNSIVTGNEPVVFQERLLSEQLQSIRPKDEDTYGTLHLENGMILEQYSCPLMDGDQITGRLWSYRDITDMKKAEDELKRLASTDSLTGLWNRRYFLDKGTQEIRYSKQTGQPLSLLFMDIDYFKQVNDLYGHAVGDEAIRYLGETLKNHVRNTDLIARMGGEEFCILVPGTNPLTAYQLAEKLRLYFEGNLFKVKDVTLRYTLSIGVATYFVDDHPDMTIDKLLDAADRACYQAKGLGRNCVVMAP